MLRFKYSKYAYRRNLPHIEKADCPHFITFRTADRFRLLPEARELVFGHCFHDHLTKITLYAAAVLPNHVHLVFTPLRNPAGEPYTFPEILGGLKGASSHSVNKLLGRHGAVWLDESFDHVIRSEERFDDRVQYVWLNPVRHHYVAYPWEYRWTWRDGLELPFGDH